MNVEFIPRGTLAHDMARLALVWRLVVQDLQRGAARLLRRLL